MIILTIACVLVLAIACNYIGYRKGMNDGIELTKREWNAKLNEHIQNAVEAERDKILERTEKFFKGYTGGQ